MRCVDSVVLTIPPFASAFHSVVCQAFAIFNQKPGRACCNFVFIVAFYGGVVNSLPGAENVGAAHGRPATFRQTIVCLSREGRACPAPTWEPKSINLHKPARDFCAHGKNSTQFTQMYQLCIDRMQWERATSAIPAAIWKARSSFPAMPTSRACTRRRPPVQPKLPRPAPSRRPAMICRSSRSSLSPSPPCWAWV